jgi:hypothetical protein
MDDRVCVSTFRDILRAKLTDPLGENRTFVHTDNPRMDARFPRVVIRKRGPTNNQIIEMGDSFTEWRSMVLDVEIWSKIGFKYTIPGSSSVVKDDEFIKYYQDTIWTAEHGRIRPRT